MSSKIQIDETDKKILSYLIKNARIPFLEIARECGISGAAIHQRVKKMEDAGIIEGSRFNVKPKSSRIQSMCLHWSNTRPCTQIQNCCKRDPKNTGSC